MDLAKMNQSHGNICNLNTDIREINKRRESDDRKVIFSRVDNPSTSSKMNYMGISQQNITLKDELGMK